MPIIDSEFAPMNIKGISLEENSIVDFCNKNLGKIVDISHLDNFRVKIWKLRARIVRAEIGTRKVVVFDESIQSKSDWTNEIGFSSITGLKITK